MSPTHPPSTPRPVAAVRLDGGRLCVDSVNTIHDRYAGDVEDYVQDPQRFIAWSERTGALRPDDGVRAPRTAHKRGALMGEMAALRVHLHALFAARIDGMVPPASAVRGLDRWLHQ